MRVSTNGLQQQAINTILAQQQRLAALQLQVGSGQRIVEPSDDPVGAQRIMELDSSLARIEQYQQNADLAQSRLQIEENALGAASDVLQRARELVIQGANATQTPETRNLIAQELQQLRDELLTIANTRNGQGEYLFGGYRSDTRPFTANDGRVQYNGDQGQRLLQISASQRISDGDHGAEVFHDIPTGNGVFDAAPAATNTGSGVTAGAYVLDPTQYDGDTLTIEFVALGSYEIRDGTGGLLSVGTHTPGDSIAAEGLSLVIDGEPEIGDRFTISPSTTQNAFASIDQIIDALSAAAYDEPSSAQARSALNQGLTNLDQALGRLLEVRTRVGSRLQAIDTQRSANAELSLQLESTRATIRDVDYAPGDWRSELAADGSGSSTTSFRPDTEFVSLQLSLGVEQVFSRFLFMYASQFTISQVLRLFVQPQRFAADNFFNAGRHYSRSHQSNRRMAHG